MIILLVGATPDGGWEQAHLPITGCEVLVT